MKVALGNTTYHLRRGGLQGVSNQGTFFQGINLHTCYFRYGRFNFFFGGGVKLSKIQFQGIYESNSHSFQSVLVFKNLVVHTLVLTKNGITHLQKKNVFSFGHGSILGCSH